MNCAINQIPPIIFSNDNKHKHNHEPSTELGVQCVRTAAKRKVQEDLHARPMYLCTKRKQIQETNH